MLKRPPFIAVATCLSSIATFSLSASPMNLSFATVHSGNPGNYFISIARGNDTLVVVGNGSSRVSANGVDWTPLSFGASKVIYAGGQFVAVNGNVGTSPDGFNWTWVTPQPADAFSVTYGNGLYVAVGRSSIFYSTDAKSWTTIPQHGSVILTSVSFALPVGFITSGVVQAFPPGQPPGNVYFASSTNGLNWQGGGFSDLTTRFYGAQTYAFGNFYNVAGTSPNGLDWTAWNPVTQGRQIKFAGDRLVALRKDSPAVAISASEGFDSLNRPKVFHSYPTGVTNLLNDVTFDGSEYYFVGEGEIILKSQGVPPPASLKLVSIDDQTATFSVTGVPGMTYGLQAFGNDFVGALPSLNTDSIFDFTLPDATTNITTQPFVNGSFYRLVER